MAAEETFNVFKAFSSLLVEGLMILSDRDIKEFMRLRKIGFEPPVSKDWIGSGSVDLTLSDRFWRLRDDVKLIDLSAMRFEDAGELVVAGELVTGMSREKIYLGDVACGWIEGRSRYAGMGLSIHSASEFIHPRSHNHQVLETLNLFKLLRSGAEKPYRLHGVIARSR